MPRNNYVGCELTPEQFQAVKSIVSAVNHRRSAAADPVTIADYVQDLIRKDLAARRARPTRPNRQRDCFPPLFDGDAHYP